MSCQTSPVRMLWCDKPLEAGRRMPSLRFSQASHLMSIWASIRRMSACLEAMCNVPIGFISQVLTAAFMTTSRTMGITTAGRHASTQRHSRFQIWEPMALQDEIPSMVRDSAMSTSPYSRTSASGTISNFSSARRLETSLTILVLAIPTPRSSRGLTRTTPSRRAISVR